MDKAKIINSARNILQDVTEVGTDLFKGILNIKDKAAGVYYIDVSGKPVEDFDQYQEDMLAKDYYNHPGSIQWNYYLLLMRDEVSDDERKKLERNDKYARKYLFTEDDFTDFFQLTKSAASVDVNILQEWKQELDSVDLQEVYGSESITSVALRFEQNKTIKVIPHKAAAAEKKGDNERLKKISTLQLMSTYRPFPLLRNYKFGSVNLIKGINGVGKTSLFEALELIICGRTFRNPDQKYDEGAIQSVFNDSAKVVQKLDCSQGANAKYRARDLAWYSNNSVRDHELDISFNRYNFFNSDAAYRFSNSTNETDVHSALFNIVFGPEYDHITSRIEKVHDKLRPLYNNYVRDQREAKNAKSLAEQEIKKLRKADALGPLKQSVINDQKLLDLIDIVEDLEKNLLKIEDVSVRIKTLLDSIKKTELLDSPGELKQKRQAWQSRNDRLESFRIKFTGFGTAKEENAIKELRLKTRQTLLLLAMKYLNDERYFQLEGVGNKIADLELELRKLEKLQSDLYEINTEKLAQESKSIPELVEEFANAKRALNKDILDRENERKAILEKFGKVEQLVQEIKSLGAEFLQNDPGATNCPLCQTGFNREDLENKIRQLVQNSETGNVDVFGALDKKLSEFRPQLELLEQRESEVKKLQGAFGSLNNFPTGGKSIKDLMVDANALLSSREQLVQQLDQFKALLNAAQSNGLSEVEFKVVKQQLSMDEPETTFNFNNKKAFEHLITAVEKALGELNTNAEQIARDKSLAEIQFKSEMGLPLEETFTLKLIRQQLDQEDATLRSIESCFEKLAEVIRFSNDTTVQSMVVNAEILSRHLALFKTELQGQEALKNQEKLLVNAELTLAHTNEMIERFEPACNKLKRMMEEKGNSKLALFFDNNLTEILDVFKSIHMPKEFSSIKIDNRQISLVTEKGTPRKITEISTGQRSALVLSIFITLNRKLKNGPDIILFDDPVSFVDDLNSLSFLDFLRYFVLKEGKQIFFATANSRLANLFERKFQFLGDEDFKVWQLTR